MCATACSSTNSRDRSRSYRQQLLAPRTALIDVTSKESIYQVDPRAASTLTQPCPVELAGKQVQLIGNFHLGTDFANDGTLLMSLENFAFYFPLREVFGDPLSTVDLGLVTCEPGTDRSRCCSNSCSRSSASTSRVYTRRGTGRQGNPRLGSRTRPSA